MPPSSADSPDLYLPVTGALLRYRDEGCGPAVLLIHGWTLDLDMWEPQVAGLGGSFRLIRFDRRGFGLSSGRASLSADVQDALSLCNELQLETFACVGMSQGARVALQLCRIAPERLFCLVLDGPPRMLAKGVAGEPVAHASVKPVDDARTDRAADAADPADPADISDVADDMVDEAEEIPLVEYRSLIARGEIDTFRRRWASHPLMQLETRSPQSRALLERMTARYSGSDLLQELASQEQASQELRLRELPASEAHWNRAVTASLRTPALVVTGEHDLPARVRAADALTASLPLSQRAIISAARHLPNLDNPPSYNAVLRTFLESHAGPRH